MIEATPPRPAWHALPADDVLAELGSGPAGLAAEDAARRLAEHGPNSLPPPERPSPVRRFLRQFNSALIWFLLASAVVSLLLRHFIDAGVILGVVVINAIIGFIQEGRAEQALAAIRGLVAAEAVVRRGGRRQTVPVADLVPGDVVTIEAGDRVPADLRLLSASGLSIDEAVLTGESVTAAKQEAPAAADVPLGDRHSMAYSGTLVTTGRGTGVVVATGQRTEIGRIARLLVDVEPLSTPLIRQIDRFARVFALGAFVAAAALFLFAVFVRSYQWIDALIAVVALAVGMIPEGLPAVITITLAIGVQRMARRRAVVRKLPAVETLGAVSVICTDKTGTLTRNEMMVRQVRTATATVEVDGDGYAPVGRLRPTEGGEGALAAIRPLIDCGILCNDATLAEEQGAWKAVGDPMEAAILSLGMKAGRDPAALRSEWPRIDEIPFDAAWRYMATLHRAPDGGRIVCIKGAPEALLPLARDADRALWEERIAEAAAKGERVLAFAQQTPAAEADRLLPADLEGGIELLGIMGFIDPPRAEAKAAIAECHRAGIAVKMITGDHELTAVAIARQLTLADDPVSLTGAAIDGMSDDELGQRVAGATVFARATPEHKLRIVRALQAGGAIVAMTGDGVNDSPSLKAADVGIAMGRNGTAAAREAAQLVLLDDNFATIVNAVHEGRTVYDNIRKLIGWMLPTDGGEVIGVILAILLGFAMPMSATQILWVNLVTSVTLGLAVAFEPSEPGVMTRPPRDPKAPLLSPFMLWRLALVSALMGAASIAMFFWTLDTDGDLEMARTMAVNMVVAAETFYLFNIRRLHRTTPGLGRMPRSPVMFWCVVLMVVAQALFTYAPFMQDIFGTRSLRPEQLLVILGVSLGLTLFLELEKRFMRWTGWFPELRRPV